METLLTTARAVGVAMGSLHHGCVIGWTTNETAAMTLREAGAAVIACYNRTGPCGWEVSVPVLRVTPFHPPV